MTEPFCVDHDMTLYCGDSLEVLSSLPDGSIGACVTSPPYLDARPEYPSPSPHEFEEIFREIGRVVAGPLLLNVGRLWRDGIERLWWTDLLERADWAGWRLRDTVIWAKPNANPIQGALLTNAHEYVFVLGDGCDPDAVRVPYAEGSLARSKRRHVSGVVVKNVSDAGRRDRIANGRDPEHPLGARAQSVVVFAAGADKGNPHPAPMPLELAKWMVRLSGGSSILDPFAGSGTTGVAARALGRASVLIERDSGYCAIAAKRLSQQTLEFAS